MASIKQISAGNAHKICSSQVIVDLRTAVKELVENALVRGAEVRRAACAAGLDSAMRRPGQDAGATKVEIRLKNYGEESIEVADDGAAAGGPAFALAAADAAARPQATASSRTTMAA